MRTEYLYIVIVAVLWGGYPLVARSAGVAGAFGTLILMLAGLLPIGVAAVWQGMPVRPEPYAIAKMVVAGSMMGIGLMAFIAVTNSKALDASISIPIMDTAMLVVTVIGAVLFFSEPMTTRKLLGLGLLIAGILTLRPS